MAWQTALDRLLLQQIHLAEKSEVRPQEVRQQILDLHELDRERPETAFHLGYGRVLLGLELPEPAPGSRASRWYTFGRLRGHDRRGERNWVADLLQDPASIMDLLREPGIAAQCLPLVMRTLFWCGNLGLALKAIEYLSVDKDDVDTMVLVEAALADLLTRLENRVEHDGEETTACILQRCIELPMFARLPNDVRARYHRALARHLLAASDFEEALAELRTARDLLKPNERMYSAVAFMAALAELRRHDAADLEPRAERAERKAALAWLDAAVGDPHAAVPEAWFSRGILAYEVGNFTLAQQCFEGALRGLRRVSGRDVPLIDRTRFFLAASILAAGNKQEASRALRLMEQALETIRPDLESFFPVHEALKELDRKLALRFLDAVDVGRGTAADQLLFVALEYVSLGEAEPASRAAERVLQVALNLDHRIEAMRVLLTASNMQGQREEARRIFQDIRELLMQRGAFQELEVLLRNEEFVGQALDHLEIKYELVALYEEMEEREYEKAGLQTAIARSLRARKDAESLQESFGILKEVEIKFPELVRDELQALEKLLALSDAEPVDPQSGKGLCEQVRKGLGHVPRVLVVGGNERQRRHHPRFEELAAEWGFSGEWLMANYTSPQRLVTAIGERLRAGIDLLVLLHWNRHETTEPALELARKAQVMARNVHYAGFTSLQVCLIDLFAKLADRRGGSGGGSAGGAGAADRAGDKAAVEAGSRTTHGSKHGR